MKENAEKLFTELVNKFNEKKKPVDIYKLGKRIGIAKGEIPSIGQYLLENNKIIFVKPSGVTQNIFACPKITD